MRLAAGCGVTLKLTAAGTLGKLYTEFGEEVQQLKVVLERVEEIVSNADRNRDVVRQKPGTKVGGSSTFRRQDEQSLLLICGNFRRTLERCKTFLQRKEFFKWHDGFIYNVLWDATGVHAEMERLKAQLHGHVMKTKAVLAPLEFQLILNLEESMKRSHADIVDRMGRHHVEIMDYLEKLSWLIVGRPSKFEQTELTTQSRTGCEIPAELEARFSLRSPYLSQDDLYSGTAHFTIGDLAGAFVAHLEVSTVNFDPGPYLAERTAVMTDYLNLMKSVWILSKIKSSTTFCVEPPESLWRRYVQGLQAQLGKQTSRFSQDASESERLTPPPLEAVLDSPVQDFDVLVLTEVEDKPGPLTEKDQMDKLLELEIPTDDKASEHHLFVLRASADTLKIKISTTTSTTTRDQKVIIRQALTEHGVNLARVQLTPLYAVPGSNAKALNMKFRDESSVGNDVPVSFKSLTDLLKFQRAITGYYVALDKRDVRTESFYQRGMSLTGNRVHEQGRVQIWVPKKLEPVLPGSGDSRHSNTSQNQSPTFGTSAAATLESISYTAVKDSSVESALPALSRASTFVTPQGLGHIHHKPKHPILVFFLSRVGDDGEQYLSFLTVKIDDQTFVRRQSCDCHKAGKSCRDSSLEHKSSALEASRYVAGTDLDAWNIAAPGLWQQDPVKPNWSKQDKTIKWIKITFSDQKDRIEFAGEKCGCKGSDLKPLDECNKRGHRGTLGKVRISHVQKLAEYHNRHNLPHMTND